MKVTVFRDAARAIGLMIGTVNDFKNVGKLSADYTARTSHKTVIFMIYPPRSRQ
jgi:hypothetical protein